MAKPEFWLYQKSKIYKDLKIPSKLFHKVLTLLEKQNLQRSYLTNTSVNCSWIVQPKIVFTLKVNIHRAIAAYSNSKFCVTEQELIAILI